MKHKIFISWVTVFTSILLLTVLFWVAFRINLILAIMIPIDIGVSTTIIPIVIIDQKLKLKDKIEKKSKQNKKFQTKGQKYGKITYRKIKDVPSFRRDDGSDIHIIGEEEATEESIKILVGDIKVLDILSNKSTKSSFEIMKENFDNTEILEIFKKNDSLNEILKVLNKFEFTSFSNEFFDKMDEFKWSDEQKLEFIKDMIIFSPRERMEILSSMTESSTVDK